MKRGTLIRALFVLGLLATVAVLVLRSSWTGQKLCAELEQRVPALAPGVKLQIRECRLDPVELGVDLLGVKVSLPNQPEPAVEAERAQVRLSIIQALWGSLRLDRVLLDKPRIQLDLSHLPESQPKPKKARAQCELASVLQQVDVGRLAVNDGSVHLLLPDSRSLELAAVDVSAQSHRGVSAVRLAQSGGKLSYPGGELPLEKIVLSGQLDAASADLEVQRVQLQGGQLSLLAHGAVRNLCDPILDVEANAGVPLDLLVALAHPEKVKATGYVTVNASLSGKLDAPDAHAEVDVTDLDINHDGDDFNPKDLSATVDVHGDKIEIAQLFWPFPDGYGRVSGTIQRKGNWPISLVVEGRNVPFGELMNRLPVKHPWVDFSANVGVKQLSGHLLPTPLLAGQARVDISDFHVRTRAWDGPSKPDDEVLHIAHANIETEVNITPERVKLSHARLKTDQGEANVEALLSTDPRKGLDLTGEITRFDLSEFGPIVGMPWSGAGSATKIHITGAYGEQVIDGNLAVKGFSFVGVHPGDVTGSVHFDPSMVLTGKDLVATMGKTTYRGRGLLDFGAKDGPLAAGSLSLENGRLEDLLEVLHDVHWSFETFYGQAAGKVSGTINLEKGPVLSPTSDIDLRLRDLVVYKRPLGDGDFHMRTQDGETIEIPDTTFKGGAGTFTFGGRQQVGGALDYHLTAKDVPAAIATSPELADWEMTGTLSGSLAITGNQAQPLYNGEVFGQDLTMYGIAAGQGHVVVKGVGNSMSVTGPVGDDVTLWSRMRWEGDFPTEAKLTFEVSDLYKYVPTRTEWNDVSGSMQGSLTLRGTMRGEAGWQGQYEFPKVVFTKGDYTEENREPVRLAFDGDRYELQSFSFRGHPLSNASGQATELSITGTRTGKEQALDLKIRGAVDARLFETLTPMIDTSSGHVDVAASVTGTQARPLVDGTLEVNRGKVKLRDYPISLDALEGTIQFTQSAVEVSQLKGVLNQGPVELSGTVGLKKFHPASYDLRLLMDETRWRIGNFPETRLSGSLQLTGRYDDPVLSGAIDVDKFVYDEDLYLDKLLESATKKKLDAQVYTKRSKVVRFADLRVNLNGDVGVDNNLVKTKLRGELSVLGDDAHPLLRGDIEAPPGGHASYRGNDFLLEHLVVSFRDSERITPEFDIHATTVARDYKISLHAFGTPDNMHSELDSSPQLSSADIVTLLTLGFTSQDRSGGGGQGATFGIATDVLSSLTGVDRAAERFIPKNSFLRDPSIRFTSAYSQALGSMQPTAEVEGKILVDQLRLRLQEPVVAGGRGLRMQGEYKFSESGSVQMQLDRDNSDYNFPDVGLDLKLRWEMK